LRWITYEFFQTREPLLLTQSALRFFFELPYRENVQFLLSEFNGGDIAGRANNGLFSDGYMNFGAASVLFYPVLCVFLLKLVEGAVEGLSTSVHFMVIVVSTFVFESVPIPTALATTESPRSGFSCAARMNGRPRAMGEVKNSRPELARVSRFFRRYRQIDANQ
jgi:hypothetical protein